LLTLIDGDATFGTREATVTIVDNDQGDCELEEVDPIIDCFWNNNGKTLQRNIEITSRGTITGGELGGEIGNDGVVQNVTLLANSQLSGFVRGTISSEAEPSGGITTVYGSGNEPNTLYINGVVRGNITSDPNAPATITNLKITVDSTLSNIIIGNGVMIETGAILKEGVLFKYNGLVPYMADLNELLGTISAPALEMDAINITNDVLVNRSINGILSTINGLYEFASLNRVIKQNPDNGYMMLDIESNRYTALPISVQQIWGSVANQALEPVGFTLHPNGEVAFVTLTGRKVIGLPVVQEPQLLREALSNVFGLHQMTMQENGNLKVPANGGNYYMARPNLFSTTITDNIPLGISSINSNRLINVMEISLVFTDSSANVRRQLMYPAAARVTISRVEPISLAK
jgi:acetyltransferase-like isoleucine patch superfamily enzyme